MVGVLILTHGRLAPELLAAARVISGNLESFEALALDWSDGFDEAQRKVQKALDGLQGDQGTLIFTDILGGTPFNVAMTFRHPGRVEIVSGVNLPMVVRLGCLLKNEMSISDLAAWIRDKGRASICSSEDLPRAEARSGDPRESARLDSCEENDD